MSKKEYKKIIEVVPADTSPKGLEELKFILEAMFSKLNACQTDEEAIKYLNEFLARPEKERRREMLAVIEDAKRKFHGKKDN